MFWVIAESMWNEGHLSRSVKADDRDKERECERDEREKDREHERDRDKERERFEKNAPFPQRDSASRSLFPNNITKPISELDLSNCLRCTPSYRLLPNYVMCLYIKAFLLHKNVLFLLSCSKL